MSGAKRKSSKRIGNQYERDFSRRLSMWFTGDPEELVTWRNVHSGSVSTLRVKKGLTFSEGGDIRCLDFKYEEFFQTFHIDTKCYHDWNSFFINKKSIKSNKIFLEWVKTIKETPMGKIPIMPVKIRDRKTEEFLIMPCLKIDIDNEIRYRIDYEGYCYNFVIVLQDEFFSKNTWEDFLTDNK